MSRRRVEAVRGDERAAVQLEWSDKPPWHVSADGPFGRIVEQDDDLFSALRALRRVLERDGWLLQVNAARVNAWPSQMALQAGGGKVYLHSIGHPARREDLVDAFAPLETGMAATVDAQKAYHDTWARARWNAEPYEAPHERRG